MIDSMNNSWSLIDIHSHLSFADFGAQTTEIIAQMRERKIGTITVGTNYAESVQAVKLAEANENIWATIGVHPQNLAEGFDEEIYQNLLNNKVVAIGECGLEYGKNGEISEGGKVAQRQLFEQQIDFAVKNNLPLMLHIRNAYEDAWQILQAKKNQYGEKLRFNLHFFAGDWVIAQKFLELGAYFSFTGVITFADQYNEVIQKLPLNRIMSETDSPFVAPTPFRGKQNSSLNVFRIVEQVAEIRGEPVEQVRQQLLTNSFDFFFKT